MAAHIEAPQSPETPQAQLVEALLRQQESNGKPNGTDDSAWQEPKD